MARREFGHRENREGFIPLRFLHSPWPIINSAILMLIFLLFSTSARANQYTIEVRADQNLKVRGKVAMIWQNDTGHAVHAIPLVCSCKLKSATARGKPLRIDHKRVLLTEAVQGGYAESLEIEFEENAKKAYGYRMLAGAWHPKAVTFRNGKFNSNQQQADDYEVTLTAPASLVVASAGELRGRSADTDGRQRYHWRLRNVTSFGLAASLDFVETRRSGEGVEIRLFQLRGDNRFDPAMADYAVDVIAFYKKLFGFYPHPAAVLLPGDFRFGGGYPPASGIMIFHKNTGENYQRWIVAHEIGHQYWGFDTVIDDGDYVHWPGLPLGIYSDQLYMASREKWGFGSQQYTQAVAKGFDTTIRRTRDQMRSWRFDWNNAICHQKAFAVVRMLEELMGTDRFLRLLRYLLDTYRYKYLSFDDFQAAVEEAAGRKLDWFFHDWVDTNGVASYAIERVTTRDRSAQVQIRRTGAARFPVEIVLTMEDGSQVAKRIAHELEEQTLDFEVSGQLKRAEIDPKGKCPLLKQGKEVWEPKSGE
jgi:hypothetical protein